MKKREAKQHARKIVLAMLGGRCCPESDDVRELTTDEAEQELIIDEINRILYRLSKHIEN